MRLPSFKVTYNSNGPLFLTIVEIKFFETLQIQFTSDRLSNDMFKISNGLVEGLATDTRCLMTENIKISNRDQRDKYKQFRNLSPDGYM